jgi:hypothetical protein
MRNYLIEDLPHYFEEYKKSIKNPKKFWDKIADQNFVWYQRWSKVVKYDMNEAKITWFKNAKLNITKNCLDRHLAVREIKLQLSGNRTILKKKHSIFLTTNYIQESIKQLMF